MKIYFASDNTAPVHPRVMKALAEASKGDASSYGADALTAQARALVSDLFGGNVEVHFVFNGTAANVLSLANGLKPFESVLCPAEAHLVTSECAALERFHGARAFGVPASSAGKIASKDLEPHLAGRGDQHTVQPRIISVSQTTECGTVYSAAELRALADFAHTNGMWLHVDGSRFANACASLGLGARELSRDCGVDILSFGGTKNGLMFGDAVVFFEPRAAEHFAFTRKQGLNLASKMRFLSAQFLELVRDGLWLENARHANAMAARLARSVEARTDLEFAYPVQSNAVFVRMPTPMAARLRERFEFYTWDEANSVVRLMTSYSTREEDVDAFAEAIARAHSLVIACHLSPG